MPLSPCKNLQGIPRNASSPGHERLRWVTADPDLPGSAAIDHYFIEPQELVAARSWRFESSLPHHSTQSLPSFTRGRPFSASRSPRSPSRRNVGQRKVLDEHLAEDPAPPVTADPTIVAGTDTSAVC